MSKRRGTPSGVDQPKTAPTWVKLLVGFHVFATTVWALPNLNDKVMNGQVSPTGTKWLLYWNAKYLKTLSPIKAYLFSTGTWQYWDMFAPDPANVDWYATAEIEYRDGTRKLGDYPRIYDLPIPMKFVKERYRKFYERAHDDQRPILWPAFAQYVALRGFTDPTNPPKIVRLTRHWRYVADPGKKQEEAYSAYTYYTYVVDQKRLKQVKLGGSDDDGDVNVAPMKPSGRTSPMRGGRPSGISDSATAPSEESRVGVPNRSAGAP